MEIKNSKLLIPFLGMILIIVIILDMTLIIQIYKKLTYNENEAKQALNSNDELNNECDLKCVAITFDDGPHPICTPRLLDGLKERNVVATFFVTGKSIEGNEAILKRISDEGHSIGNHTYDHVNLKKIPADEAINQIEKENELIYNITGKYPILIRPPFGEYSRKMLDEVDMILALWTVDPRDSTKTRPSWELTNKIVKNTKAGDIILLHDIFESSVDAALDSIDKLKEEGYTFVTLEDLILD